MNCGRRLLIMAVMGLVATACDPGAAGPSPIPLASATPAHPTTPVVTALPGEGVPTPATPSPVPVAPPSGSLLFRAALGPADSLGRLPIGHFLLHLPEQAVEPVGYLTDQDQDPSSSPAGDQTVFARVTPGTDPVYTSAVHLHRIRTGELVRLTNPAWGGMDGAPTWSPDGRLVAFSFYTFGPGTSGRGRLYLADAVSGSVLAVPTSAVEPCCPTLSPDGEWLTYLVNLPGGPDRPGLYLVRRDGSDERRLVDGLLLQGASWLPDMSGLVYVRVDETNSDLRQIEHYDLRSGRIDVVSLGLENADLPQVSPLGDRVVFVSTPVRARSDLYLAALDGGPPLQITRTESINTRPRWSPDGGWIAFVSDRSGRPGLYLIDGQGHVELRVYGELDVLDIHAWSP